MCISLKFLNMKKLLLAVAILGLSATAIAFVSRNDTTATCTGSKNCKACKNCKYCKHCAKQGGTCGVCTK